MDLNPIVKKKINCLTSMEQAWERLLSVTKERTPLTVLMPDIGVFGKADGIRYIGRLDKYKFTLAKRTTALLSGMPSHQMQFLVINGEIKPGDKGCTIDLRIRPHLPIVFAWIGLVCLFFGLLWGVLVTPSTLPQVYIGMFVSAGIFLGLNKRYRRIVNDELEFLEVIFGAEQKSVQQQMAPSIG